MKTNKNNSAAALQQMGCGKEMVNCQIERGNLSAAIYNAKQLFKYVTHYVKSGMGDIDSSYSYIRKYYERLKELQPLADKFNQLHSEEYYKIKLKIERFYSI